jgi:phospholipid N-methyltransferase
VVSGVPLLNFPVERACLAYVESLLEAHSAGPAGGAS